MGEIQLNAIRVYKTKPVSLDFLMHVVRSMVIAYFYVLCVTYTLLRVSLSLMQTFKFVVWWLSSLVTSDRTNGTI